MQLLSSGQTSDVYLLPSGRILLCGRAQLSFAVYQRQAHAARLAQTAVDCVAFPRDMRLYLPSGRYPFGALEYPFVPGEPMRPGLLAPAELEQATRGAARFCTQLHSITDEACRPNIVRAEEEFTRRSLAIAQNLLSDAELALLCARSAQYLDILRSRVPSVWCMAIAGWKTCFWTSRSGFAACWIFPTAAIW